MVPSVFVRRNATLTVLTALVYLSGCAVKPQPEVPGQSPPVKTSQQPTAGGTQVPTAGPQPSTLALAEGVDLYNQGQYQAAIRKLQETPDIRTVTANVQVEAFKYLAFSQCVTRQPSQCRQSFERLLNVAPTFELSRAEAGHPLWGPVFKAAQQATRKAAPGAVRP